MPNTSVLIVEDEVLIAEGLRDIVEECGHEVLEVVASADAAIASVRRAEPGVVLMDVRLKGDDDGIDAAVAILEHHGVPVIFMTAHSDKGTIDRAMLTRPTAYLLKPVCPTELALAIQASINQRTLEDRMDAVETHFRQIVEFATDLVVRIGPSGRLMYANPVALGVLGLTHAEACRKQFANVIRPADDDAFRRAYEAAVSGETTCPFRLTLRPKGGGECEVEGTFSGRVGGSVWGICHPVRQSAPAPESAGSPGPR